LEENVRTRLRRAAEGASLPHLLLAFLCILASCSDSSAPPKQAVVATPVDPATAGTIHVDVSYTGAVPTPAVFDMRIAPQCAAQHQEPVTDNSLLVQDGHLANAVVWIKEGLEKWVFAPPSEPVVMDQKGCVYHPHVAAAMVGQAVDFLNSDPEAHNVHARPQIVTAFNFLMSRQGSKRTLTFDKPEIAIPVGCDIHPWMSAYLAVVPNPYVAVTPATGAVTLANVPPGEYVVAVWQEKLGTKEQRVKVEPRGSVNVQVGYGGGN
jgi:plastocyanin